MRGLINGEELIFDPKEDHFPAFPRAGYVAGLFRVDLAYNARVSADRELLVKLIDKLQDVIERYDAHVVEVK